VSKRQAYRTVGFIVLRGGRFYIRLRYPNLLRQALTVVASIAVVAIFAALLSALSGRSNVNAMTP